ncbi:hypothetical protein [Mesobacillus foraminis]|uniref:hypothetical protein n=1 Tax=Mesobacillus foraminis TaxID=279826 RepID=UPI0010536707|nr:hypothetical protein [Mesobacillus foraminis]
MTVLLVRIFSNPRSTIDMNVNPIHVIKKALEPKVAEIPHPAYYQMKALEPKVAEIPHLVYYQMKGLEPKVVEAPHPVCYLDVEAQRPS